MTANPESEPRHLRAARRNVANWFKLAVGSLLLAGFFSLMLILGRTPPVSGWVSTLIPDPAFFRRCLVVHVDLALIVWFYAFFAGLYQLLPTSPADNADGGDRGDRGDRDGRRWTERIEAWAPGLSAMGVVLLVLSAGIENAEPVLSNYIPVVDHPLYLSGLALFAGGIVLTIVSRKTLVGDERVGNKQREGVITLPPAARPGLRTGGVALLIGLLTIAAAWQVTPTNLDTQAYYELVFWGGGHVFQVASVAAMLSIWTILLSSLLGRPVIGRRAGVAIFGVLLAPHLVAPLLTWNGTQTALYHSGSTRLMEFGIFPAVLWFLYLAGRSLWWGAKTERLDSDAWRDPRLIGFATSAGLTLIGFVLGATIGSSTTTIPAHYHANIGAVTVAFMTIALWLLAPLGYRLPSGRLRSLARLQPALFGVGQLVFALGFGLAGAHGMARKVYGAEQTVRGLADWLGLVVMGLGGLVAIAGGLLFLVLMVSAWMPRVHGALRRVVPTTLANLLPRTNGVPDE